MNSNFTDFKSLNLNTMTKEEQIIQILTKHSIDSPTAGRTILYENDFDYVAEEIVKLFAIPDVVGQSEQLVCSCGCKKVKTNSGYECGNAKCNL